MQVLHSHYQASHFRLFPMTKLLPCLEILLGATLYGTMSSCVKLAGSQGFSAPELAFWQATGAALSLTICTLSSRQLVSWRDTPGLLATGTTLGLTNLFYYESLATLHASVAVVILMQFTWLTLLTDFLLWHRRPTRTETFAAAGVLAGSVPASGIFETAFSLSLEGLCYAFACATTYAIYVCLGSRISSGAPWLPKSALIMTGSAAVIALARPNCLVTESITAPAFAGWVAVLALAGCALPTTLFAAGVPRAGAASSAVLMTAELPVALLTAHLVLGESVSFLQVAGVAIMLGAIGLLNQSHAG